MKFFDAHTHVQFAAYDADRKETMERAFSAGVSMINVGTQADTSAAAVKLANEYPDGVFAAIGLHPVHTEKSFHDENELGLSSEALAKEDGGPAFAKAMADKEEFDYDYYKKLALDPKTVAIGECGLDYYHLSEESKKSQKEVFIKQIELAKEVGKPLMIHCREAFADLIDILTSNSSFLNSQPGVVHFFSGTEEDAEKLMKLGFSFTFGGTTTFPPRKGETENNNDKIVKMLPLDRILSETDAPYVAPMPYRGKRNEPAYVVEVVKKLAGIKGISVEEMAEKIFENAARIFKI